MPPLVLVLPEALEAFLEAEVARTGCGTPTAYLSGLLEHARAKAAAARLEALLLAGLASEPVPEAFGAAEAFGDGAGDASGQAAGNALVHRAACEDVRRELDRYAARGLDAIATRFERAVCSAVLVAGSGSSAGEAWSVAASALATPALIDPGLVDPRLADPRLADPRLAGLQAWPVKGFSGQRIYGLMQDGRAIVLRVLHDTRDLAPEVPFPSSP